MASNKVDQLDANLYDDEVIQVLLSLFNKVFATETVVKSQSELKLFVEYLYFRFTVMNERATVGEELLNLQYKFRSKRQRFLLLLLKILLPYVYDKIVDFTLRHDWSNQSNLRKGFKGKVKYILAFWLRFVGKLAQVAELLNFLAFMRGVKQARRCVTETLLGVRLVPRNKDIQERYLSFHYVNILVVWGALGRSLTKLLPIIDLSQMRRLLSAGADQLSQTITFVDDSAGGQDQLCPVCGTTDICMPVEPLPCKCSVYCYHCAGTLLLKPDKKCAKCEQAMESVTKLDLSA